MYSNLFISDILAVDLKKLLCEGLFLLGGGWHHSGLAQGREDWGMNAFWSRGAIGVLEEKEGDCSGSYTKTLQLSEMK